MSIVRYTVTLHPILDARVIKWLEQQPNMAAAIREALYQHLDQPSRAELAVKLDQLAELIKTHPSPPLPELPPKDLHSSEEPEAAQKGLDRMLNRFKTGLSHTHGCEQV
jgi:hypothetical protein